MQIPNIVIYMYVVLCIAAVAAIICLLRTLRYMIRKKESKILIGLVAVLLAGCVWGGGEVLLDLPCMISGELETAVGYVTAHDSAGREEVVESRGIVIETESGERIKLTTCDTPIHPDEYLEIAYLPHTHLGVIVERIA